MKTKLIKFFKAVWKYIVAAKVELIVLAAIIALDLASKAIVDGSMTLYQSITVIPKFFHITYIHNTGAAFGSKFGLDKLLGEEGTMIFFIVLTIVAVGFFVWLLYRGRDGHIVNRLALSLIIGGAIGNLVDRIAFGYVRDFCEIEYFGLEIAGSTSFAIFNIADAALTIGVILYAVYYIFIYKEPKKEQSESEATTEQEVDEHTHENND